MSGILGTILQTVENSGEIYSFPKQVTETLDGTADLYVFSLVKDIIKGVDFFEGSQLKTLGSYTFYRCSKLESIDLSNCAQLVNIKDSCFSYCQKLISIIFSEHGSFKNIGSYCFEFTSLTNIHFPITFDSFLGMYHFRGCSKLVEVTFDEDTKIESLGSLSFYQTGLTKFEIPASVKSFGTGSLLGSQISSYQLNPKNTAFEVYDGNLYTKGFSDFVAVAPLAKNFTFHPKCTKILGNSFSWTKMNQIIIPEFISKFNMQVFNCAYDLKSIEIRNATSIPIQMFVATSSLTTLILPPNLQEIGASFISSSGLKELTIPASVTNIDNAFAGCRPDIKITFEPGSPFSFENGFVYNSEVTRIHGYFGNNKTIKINPKILIIDGSTFSGNSLTSIELPPKLEELGSECFKNTKNLYEITLPVSLKIIGSNCFINSAIKSIIIPGNVHLSNDAFVNSGLETVVIESGVLSLSERCFYLCKNLQNITISGTIKTIGVRCFYNSSLNKIIFNQACDGTLLSIDQYAFSGTSLETLILPSHTASIGDFSFSDSLLKKVDLGNTQITKISNGAFKGCSRLSSITHSKVVTSFGSSAFEGCGFASFVIPSTIESLGPKAIGENLNLRTVMIDRDSKLSAIVGTSFRGCIKLREFICNDFEGIFQSLEGVLVNTARQELCVYPPAAFLDAENSSAGLYYSIPSSVEHIGASAFLDSRLKFIDLHERVSSIGEMAFDGCMALKKIVIRGDVMNVNEFSFGGIDLPCGLIECTESVGRILSEVAGVPQLTVEACPTYDVRDSNEVHILQMLTLLLCERE